MTTPPETLQPETLACHAGVGEDPAYGAIAPPLYLSSNYTFAGLQTKGAYEYTRLANPTRDTVAGAIAELEGGAGAVVTASGMAAMDLLSYAARPSDLILAPQDCYGGTYRLLTQKASQGYFRVKFIDPTCLETLSRALDEEPPKLLLLESPSNPLLRLTDIEAACRLAKPYNTLCAVDNTFMSPLLQTPLALGADVVIHSTTKYLNGHSDVVGGALVSATTSLHQFFADWAGVLGNTGAPFDSYLTLRGLRTLGVRIRQQEQSAQKLAEMLTQHPAVVQVNYPGLPSHPQHALAVRQQAGFGAMLSFELQGGEAALRCLMSHLKLFSLAGSLGGFESLIAHPASMTHATMDPAARQAAGISDQLLRLSVGLEATDDLLADLLAALDTAHAQCRVSSRD